MQRQVHDLVIGSGVVPLLLSQVLMADELSVALVSPSKDFFTSDWVLGFEPDLLRSQTIALHAQKAIEIFKKFYPMSVQVQNWAHGSVRSKNGACFYLKDRVWVDPAEDKLVDWAEERGLALKWLESWQLDNRFQWFGPWFNEGFYIPSLPFLDLSSFRLDLLSSMHSRLQEYLVLGAQNLDLCDGRLLYEETTSKNHSQKMSEFRALERIWEFIPMTSHEAGEEENWQYQVFSVSEPYHQADISVQSQGILWTSLQNSSLWSYWGQEKKIPHQGLVDDFLWKNFKKTKKLKFFPYSHQVDARPGEPIHIKIYPQTHSVFSRLETLSFLMKEYL